METILNITLQVPALALIIGFILDTIIGDPYKMPHPIKLFGNLIAAFERKLNEGKEKFLKGVISTLILVSSVWIFFYFLLKIISPYPIATLVVTSVFVFYGIANHMLIKEGLKVEKALRNQGLDAGRKAVSMIVGRETGKLTTNQIRKAVLETISENLSDGVIAPLFYYALGGIPAMMAYKMINTLDSMIGYKNDRYKEFGYFAAKLDDVANFIPARITALLMVAITFSLRGLKFIFKYGNKHSSPNAGYPEAALAGIINVQFGGPNYYHGKLVEKPYIGSNEQDITPAHIFKASTINFAVSVVAVVIIILLLN